MSFHMIAYTTAFSGSATNQDMTAATDSEISQRNSHYILTEDYKMLFATYFGATATRLNILAPSWNQVTKFNVWPPMRAVTVPSAPYVDNWTSYPPPMPQNEEIQFQASDTAAEQCTAFAALAPSNWTRNVPQGKMPLPVMEARINFTAASITQNLWSGLQSITFEQSLRGGTYSLVGAEIQGANLLAARFVFPRAPIYKTRKLRPGVICQNAIGDTPIVNRLHGPLWLGELGRFSTFEPPQMEFWINTTGTPAIEGRLYLVWLSDSMDVQY